MLKNNQIDAFRAVMSTGSITNAAKLLNKSQPSITRFIRDLEREIGFDLFHRTGSKVVPNNEADAFLKAVERSFAGLLELSKAAEDIRNLSDIRLSVATIPSATFNLLPDAVSRIQSGKSNVSVSTSVHRSPNVVERIRLQQATLGICNLAEDERGVSILDRFTLPCVLVVPEGHEFACKSRVTPSDIAGQPFISLGIEYFASQGLKLVHLNELKEATVIETPLSHSACSYVYHGLGIAIVDPLTAFFYQKLGLHTVELDPPIPYDLSLICSSFESPERGRSMFVDAMRACLAENFGTH